MSEDDIKAASRPQPGSAGDGGGRMAKLSATTMSRMKEEPNQLLVLMGDAEGALLSRHHLDRTVWPWGWLGAILLYASDCNMRLVLNLSSSLKHDDQYAKYRHVFSRLVVGMARRWFNFTQDCVSTNTASVNKQGACFR